MLAPRSVFQILSENFNNKFASIGRKNVSICYLPFHESECESLKSQRSSNQSSDEDAAKISYHKSLFFVTTGSGLSPYDDTSYKALCVAFVQILMEIKNTVWKIHPSCVGFSNILFQPALQNHINLTSTLVLKFLNFSFSCKLMDIAAMDSFVRNTDTQVNSILPLCLVFSVIDTHLHDICKNVLLSINSDSLLPPALTHDQILSQVISYVAGAHVAEKDIKSYIDQFNTTVLLSEFDAAATGCVIISYKAAGKGEVLATDERGQRRMKRGVILFVVLYVCTIYCYLNIQPHAD
jgi:hypothetical protein